MRLDKIYNENAMRIHNPLQMNDWGIEKFLRVVLAIQLAMWGVIGLDAIRFQIPIIRQIISFIYLTFIPGVLILRILRVHKLNIIENILYSVGLSIAFLMLTGLFMNAIYPYFGISKPISLFSLIITLTIATTVLCILAYKRDKDFSDPTYLKMKNLFSLPALFLILLPFFAILGTYLVNFYHSNIILMILIPVIALIPILIIFNKFIPKNLYPLAVFAIAITLLFHTSLISIYISGWDIHYEYYFSSLVIKNSIWDSTIPINVNAMLSIVMLAPIYSIISNISLAWIFKIIYPLLFALVPLGLYRVFQKQTDDKIAFLSYFFFVSFFIFYTEMLGLARQQIAELFLVLLILVMINKKMDEMKRSFLFIVFGVSLAVSHYGTSYIYMFCLISAWLILALAMNPEMQKLMSNFRSKFSRKKEHTGGIPVPLKAYSRIRPTFVLLFITFTLTWYIYTSSSVAFDAIVHIGNHIISSISTDFLNPEAAQGLGLIIGETVSPLHSASKYLHLISQFFIFVGLITLVLKRKEMKFEKEYRAFCYVNFAICFAGVALPYFANVLNTSRLYQITLIFLAPFCVIGAITVFKVLSKVVKASWTDQCIRSSLKTLSLFFAIFLLFNSGWVYEIAEDHPTSISLSQESIKNYGDITDIRNYYINWAYLPEQNIFGIDWLSKSGNDDFDVYADYFHKTHVLLSYGMIEDGYELLKTSKVVGNSYFYLGYLNVRYGLMRSYSIHGYIYWNITDILPLLLEANKIYSNGGCEILFHIKG